MAVGIYFGLRPLVGSEEVEFLYPKKLVFKSDSLYYDAMKDAIAEGEKPPRKRKTRKPQPPAGKEQ